MTGAPANFHFLGICGTAMGSVAAALRERGFTVTGSDEKPPPQIWDSEPTVRSLLADFDLEVERGTWWVEGASTDEIWEWFGRAVPPHRERLRRMAPDRIESLRRDWAELYERYREGDRIRHPRPYLLVTGVRR